MKLAWRRLAATPGVALAMIGTIGLGIGANLAVFSVLDPLLLQQLPVRAPSELVQVHSRGLLGEVDIAEAATFHYLKERRDLFDDTAWDTGSVDASMLSRGMQWSTRVESVSPNFFAMLGIAPMAGRLSADRLTEGSAVVLDFYFWTRAFQRDPSVIGDSVVIDDRPATIVGVAPSSFFGVTVGDRPDAYVLSATATPAWLRILARLAPSRTATDVESALSPTFSQISGQDLPEVERQQHMLQPVVSSIERGLTDLRAPLEKPAWVILAMVVLLMIISASNVGSVLLARQTSRQGETAVELALGASRLSVARAAVLDAIIVVSFGALAGGGIAAALGVWLRRTLTSTYGITLPVGVSPRIFALAATALGLSVAIAGVVPAIVAGRTNVMRDLRQAAGRAMSAASWMPRALFVSAQVGAAITLVATAGLFLRSFANLHWADVGFDRDRVAALSLTDHARMRSAVDSAALIDRLMTGVGQRPGVAAVAMAPFAPFSGNMIGINVTADLEGSQSPKSVKAFFMSVTPSYFDVLGLKVQTGNIFSAADETSNRPLIVLNATLANQLFGHTTAVDRQVRFVEGRRPPMTVVGIVSDAKYADVREEPTGFAYILWPRQSRTLQRATLLVRGKTPALAGILSDTRQYVQGLDSQIAIVADTTVAALIARTVRVDRAVALLCSMLGILAMTIVAVGLYGVLSTIVGRRTREIGIRLALGATVWNITGLLASAALSLIAGGMILGVGGATLARALISSQLFHVPRFDVLTAVFGTVIVGVVVVAAFAVPVWRATRTNPVEVLRDA